MDIFTNKEHTVDLRNVMTLAQIDGYEFTDPGDLRYESEQEYIAQHQQYVHLGRTRTMDSVHAIGR